jgi:hypothetical protein
MTPANWNNAMSMSAMDSRFRGNDELNLRSFPLILDACNDWQRHPILRHGSQPAAG